MLHSLTALIGSFRLRIDRPTLVMPCVSVLVLYLVAASTAEPVKKPSPRKPSSRQATEVPNLAKRKSGQDWPSFLGPDGNSKSPEKGLTVPWPETGPRIVWQKKLGVSYGPPAISRGRLFQFDRFENQARLTCIQSETGAFLWKFEYPMSYEDLYGYNNGPRAAPIVDEERVYIFGAEGMLHCLKVLDGTLLWKIDTQERFGVIQNFFGVASAPLVEKDLLIVAIGGSPAESKALPPGQLDRVKGNGSGIVAFDKRSGEIKYQITDELASYAAPVAATIDGRRWCFALMRGGLVAFEPSSGKVDFHFPWRASTLESVNASNPVVVDDLVFISETYGPGSALLRVKPQGYEAVWSDEMNRRDKRMQTHWNTCVHHEGYLYGSSGRHSGNAELRCVELSSGEVKWSEPNLSRCSLLYVDEHFICLSEYGELLLLKANPEKFDVVSRVVLPAKVAGPLLPGQQATPLLKYPAWAAPVLAHGLLYIRGDDTLVCLEVIPEKK